ncbi:TetR/AcrR family transcriptional regulator [Gordonia shandongensis]|uniref:TetR/AcrR family transcriptional regulator n=1 Tax=Gordonia shandongensis TaxID=376351 RepID=UPI00041B17ED|nr:TetR/AcrR family transcriptional regulator [Gordonia shandongensis]
MPSARRRLRTSTPVEEQEGLILAAARREFTETGVRRANMDTVARAAGVSRSTLYRRFPNKDVLLGKLGEQIARDVLRRLDSVVRGRPPRDAVVEAFVECTRIVATDPLVHRLLIDDPYVGEVLINQNASSAPGFIVASATAVATSLRRAGAAMPDDQLHLAAEHLVRITLSLAQIRTPGLDITDEAAIRAYAETFLAPVVR